MKDMGVYYLAEVFNEIISQLEEKENECVLKAPNTEDIRNTEYQKWMMKSYGFKESIEIIKHAVEFCKNGHFGCNSNGEHEKCKNCGVYDCKIRNTIWFGCKESGDWIRCDERMPTERDSIFKKFKGTDIWSNSMFERISDDVNVTIEFEDGSRKTMTAHTMDGEWRINLGVYFKVIAWKPLPEYYRG